MSIFFRSTMCFCVPHLYSKIPKIYNWSMDNGVHSVCFRGDFAIKTVVGFLRKNSFENVAHVQAFYSYAVLFLLTNLVIVFVHRVSTGVLYEPRHCFGTVFLNLNFVFASICAARPVHIQSDQYRSCSTVNNMTTRSRHSSRWGATKNSAVALSSRNNMIPIHQRSARTNEGKTTLI